MVRFQILIEGRDNNFNLLRMVAATSVLISHAYPLSMGNGTLEPLVNVLGISLGDLAVLAFFVISGFFISSSFDRRCSFVDFCLARVLRIYPGLLVVLLLTTLILGTAFTTNGLKSYFSDPATWFYLSNNLSLKFLQYDLPGVFQTNPYPAAINGSLWTLFYEVSCYAMVAIIGSLGLTKRPLSFVLWLLLYIVGYLALTIADDRSDILRSHGTLRNFYHLSLPFVVGIVFYQFRCVLPLGAVWCLGAVGLAVGVYGRSWFPEIFVLCWCYIIFYLGYLPWRPLRLYNHFGDYSYGLYIYAFPIEQILAAVWKPISPLGMMTLSFPATLGFAILSWHLMEKPLLATRPIVAAWLHKHTYRLISDSSGG